MFLRHWREKIKSPHTLIVAVSGGVDSVVLFDLLRTWQPMLGYNLAVAHVFHGEAGGVQGAYRKRALAFTEKLALAHDVEFLTNASGPKQKLKSEADLRDFRRGHLLAWAAKLKAAIATAHTADDLLETRLLRLIRGTGAMGFQALRADSGEWIRPLLFATKLEVEVWANQRKLKFTKDPSNSSDDPLRNWVRNKWLEALDVRDPAARKNMARSFEMLAEAIELQSETGVRFVGSEGLERGTLGKMPIIRRRQTLALYLRRSGLISYTQRHIDEVLKRLDTNQNELTFKLLGRDWLISRDWIRVL